MRCHPYTWFAKFALLLLPATPAAAQSPLEKAAALIEQAKAQKGTDTAAARQHLQGAIALLDGADPGFTDENTYVLRWKCGGCAWRLDSDVGVKAWSGVIAYLTRNGDEPADPDQFRYLQDARHFKANELQEKREQGPDAEKQRQRNFAEAIGLREAAVKAWDKLGDKVAAADARACLGQAMVLGGVVAQGLKGLEITAQACKEMRAAKPDSRELATALRMYANQLNDMSLTYDEHRLDYQDEALRILRAHARDFPKDDELKLALVDLLWETANTWQYHLRMDKARALALEALQKAEEFGKDDMRTFWPRSFYANVLHRTGDFQLALELDQDVIRIADANLPKPSFERMFAYKEYGHALMQVKQWEKAIQAFERALEHVDPARQSPLELESVAFLFDNMGCCLAELGRTEEAAKLLERANALIVRESSREGLFGGVGKVLQRSGKFKEAADTFDRAMPDVLQSGSFRRGVNHLGWQAMTLAALQPFDGRRLADCLDQLLKLAHRATEDCYTLPGRPSHELASQADEAAQIVLSLADRVGARKDELERRAFETLESLRGIEVRVTSLGTRLLRKAEDRKVVDELLATARDLRTQLARLRLGETADDKAVKALVLARDQAESRLRERIEKLGGTHMHLSVDDVANKLPKDGAALVYRVVTITRPDPAQGGKRETTKDQYEAYIITRVAKDKGRLVRVVLGEGETEPIRKAADDWREAIVTGNQERGRPGGGKKADPGRELKGLVFDKLLKELGGVKVLVTCLDGDLHSVPVELLPTWGEDKGKARAFEFRFATSLLDLIDPPPPLTAAPSMLAIGGVTYNERAADDAGDGGTAPVPAGRAKGGDGLRSGSPIPGERSYPFLDGTKQEAVKIVQAFNTKYKTKIAPVLGRDASCRRLLEQAPKVRYLHIGTHGDFREPASAAITGLAPMTTCELELAGADLTGKDGYIGAVTGEEIAGLDLSGCELATLSACHTYRGKLRKGHGLASLQAAFHAAGARTVIATRWQINDEASAALMTRFYTALFEGKKPRVALELAKQAMEHGDYKRIKHWAGFILTGDLVD